MLASVCHCTVYAIYNLPPLSLSLPPPSLQAVSELGTAAFTSGEVSSSIVIGNEYIVPGLKAFSQHPFNGDEPILERVREEWCRCLDGSLTEGEKCLAFCL